MKYILQLSSELPEEELEPLSMANGHACLGESLLYFGESVQSESHLKTALRLFKNYKGPDNVQLDLANVLHFLGEVYSNRYICLKSYRINHQKPFGNGITIYKEK